MLILTDESQSPARRRARGPGPLKVESAEMAGDIDDFADKEEAGNLAASPSSSQTVRWYRRHRRSLRLSRSLRYRQERRSTRAVCFSNGRRARHSSRKWSMQLEPAVGEALRQRFREFRSQGRESSAGRRRIRESRLLLPCRAQDRCWIGVWFFPIRRNLQNRWAAESAMRDQHLLAKLLSIAGSDDVRRNAGQIAIVSAIFGSSSPKAPVPAAALESSAKLPRQIVAE